MIEAPVQILGKFTSIGYSLLERGRGTGLRGFLALVALFSQVTLSFVAEGFRAG